MTHFCMYNCGVRKNPPRHSVNAINNVADDGLLTIAPTALEATLRLWPRVPSVRFVTVFVIIVQICGRPNNRHFLFCVAFSSNDAHCLVSKLSGQRDLVNFALSSIAWSIGVSRY